MVPQRLSFRVENPGGERLYFTAAYYNGGYHCVLNFVDNNRPCAFFVKGLPEVSTLTAVIQHGCEWPLVRELPEHVRTGWLLKILQAADIHLERITKKKR